MIKLSPKKSLGQHFLRCRWVVSTLLKAADVSPRDTVLEIGPGTGVLTHALSSSAQKVIAVEKDERIAQELENVLSKQDIRNVDIVKADILAQLPRLRLGNVKIVANIPYYITSRLLRALLEAPQKPKLIALTIQKEVAERITAKPPHMNLLALSVQAYGKPKIIKKVPAECFSPKPKVDSSIIVISDISDDFFRKNNISETKFFEIVRYAFSQKRKTILTSLKKLIPELTPLILEKLAIKKTARPQELSLEQWAHIVAPLTKASPW